MYPLKAKSCIKKVSETDTFWAFTLPGGYISGAVGLLCHVGEYPAKSSLSLINAGNKEWGKAIVSLHDALLNNGGEKGANLIQRNTKTTNGWLCLIAVDKSNANYQTDKIF